MTVYEVDKVDGTIAYRGTDRVKAIWASQDGRNLPYLRTSKGVRPVFFDFVGDFGESLDDLKARFEKDYYKSAP